LEPPIGNGSDATTDGNTAAGPLLEEADDDEAAVAVATGTAVAEATRFFTAETLKMLWPYRVATQPDMETP
jgi:hypothetical protein